jgi:hypothetical protein
LVDAGARNLGAEARAGLAGISHFPQLVEAFPSPDHVREEMRGNDNPSAAVSLITAASTLAAAAAYLEEHGGEQPAPTASTCSTAQVALF